MTNTAGCGLNGYMLAKLTIKQRRFIDEYLVDLNATQAAVRAGYSSKRVDAIGYENLRKPDIAAAVREAQKARAESTGRQALDVLKDIQDVTQAARSARDFRAALKGLEMEGRHLGMFTDRVEHSGGLELIVALPEVAG